MALSSIQMVRFIQANGHLKLDGTETAKELRDALTFLYEHDWESCHRREFGTPIAALIPDIRAIKGVRTRSKRVVNVDMSNEKL